MGCITEILSRGALLYFWLATPLVNRAFEGVWIWPLLGFFFLPCATLVYTLAYAPGIGVTGWGWLWVVLAFLIDIGAHGHSARSNRHRLPGYKAGAAS